MPDYTHPLCELPGWASAGYPSATTPGSSKPAQVAVDPSGTILALRFVGDLGKLQDARRSYRDDGTSYPPKPEWITKAVNTPVTYKRGARVRVNVTIDVDPARQFFTLVGDGGADYLRFEQHGVISTDDKQYVLGLRAKAPLPRKVFHERRSIRWYAKGNGWRVDLGASGPHDIFVLWGSPITASSRGFTNVLTYKRARLLTSTAVGGGLDSVDAIARRLHRHLNGPVVQRVDWATPDPGYSSASQFWAILDGGQKSHCFEGSVLMELMLGAMGIPAEQHHLHGGTTRQLIEAHLDHGFTTKGQQKRTCTPHGAEQLSLLYGTRFQEGQGCCMVNKRLYAVFVAGHIIGIAGGGRSAAHDALAKLERRWKPSNPRGVFQVWTSTHTKSDGTKEEWECLAPAVSGGQGVPAPPVPQ